MKEFEEEYQVFSPRWGHPDAYRVQFTEDELTITVGASMKHAACKIGEDGDPEWSGYNAHMGHPLVQVLHNDHIYVDDVIELAIESAWERWKEREVLDEELRSGLQSLFGWIDQIGRTKPGGEFWSGVF